MEDENKTRKQIALIHFRRWKNSNSGMKCVGHGCVHGARWREEAEISLAARESTILDANESDEKIHSIELMHTSNRMDG